MAELTHETVKRLRERIIEMRSDGLMLWTHPIFAYIDQLETQVAALKAENATLIAHAVDAMGGFTDEPLTAEQFIELVEQKWQACEKWEELATQRIKALTARAEKAEAQVERLTAPFTERDVDKLHFVISMLHEDVNKPTHKDVLAAMNAMLQERAATPAIHPACDHEWRIDTGGECPKCAQPAPDGSSHD